MYASFRKKNNHTFFVQKTKIFICRSILIFFKIKTDSDFLFFRQNIGLKLGQCNFYQIILTDSTKMKKKISKDKLSLRPFCRQMCVFCSLFFVSFLSFFGDFFVIYGWPPDRVWHTICCVASFQFLRTCTWDTLKENNCLLRKLGWCGEGPSMYYVIIYRGG